MNKTNIGILLFLVIFSVAVQCNKADKGKKVQEKVNKLASANDGLFSSLIGLLGPKKPNNNGPNVASNLEQFFEDYIQNIDNQAQIEKGNEEVLGENEVVEQAEEGEVQSNQLGGQVEKITKSIQDYLAQGEEYIANQKVDGQLTYEQLASYIQQYLASQQEAGEETYQQLANYFQDLSQQYIYKNDNLDDNIQVDVEENEENNINEENNTNEVNEEEEENNTINKVNEEEEENKMAVEENDEENFIGEDEENNLIVEDEENNLIDDIEENYFEQEEKDFENIKQDDEVADYNESLKNQNQEEQNQELERQLSQYLEFQQENGESKQSKAFSD